MDDSNIKIAKISYEPVGIGARTIFFDKDSAQFIYALDYYKNLGSDGGHEFAVGGFTRFINDCQRLRPRGYMTARQLWQLVNVEEAGLNNIEGVKFFQSINSWGGTQVDSVVLGDSFLNISAGERFQVWLIGTLSVKGTLLEFTFPFPAIADALRCARTLSDEDTRDGVYGSPYLTIRNSVYERNLAGMLTVRGETVVFSCSMGHNDYATSEGKKFLAAPAKIGGGS